MPRSGKMSISVVGAGIAGLTLVLALQKLGFKPKLFEQSPVLGEVGAGIMLTPNSSLLLNYLGLSDRLIQASIQPENNYLYDYLTDVVVSKSDLGMRSLGFSGKPFRTIHRADLHAILCAAVRTDDPECIRLGHNLIGLSEEGSHVRLVFENGAIEQTDILIGSDGIRSVIRTKLFDESKPVFTGNVAWRGVVSNSAQNYRMEPSDMGNWIGPKRNVVVYPLRGGSELNYVAISERDTWVEEGWNVQSNPAELVQEFSGWSGRLLTMFANTPPDKCFKWGLFDRAPMARIVRGRVALIGDAAHPMLPFLAQGSAMGIEDAIVIARCLASGDNPVDALQSYQATRLERTSWVQTQARKARRLFHSDGGEMELEAREERSRKIYTYNAITVPIISYTGDIANRDDAVARGDAESGSEFVA